MNRRFPIPMRGTNRWISTFPYPLPAGPPFLDRQEKGGKEGGSSNAGGAYLPRRPSGARHGIRSPTSLSGVIWAVLLVPRAGGTPARVPLRICRCIRSPRGRSRGSPPGDPPSICALRVPATITKDDAWAKRGSWALRFCSRLSSLVSCLSTASAWRASRKGRARVCIPNGGMVLTFRG